MLFVRFANSIIEPLLNRTHVGSIQITMAEAQDRAGRIVVQDDLTVFWLFIHIAFLTGFRNRIGAVLDLVGGIHQGCQAGAGIHGS